MKVRPKRQIRETMSPTQSSLLFASRSGSRTRDLSMSEICRRGRNEIFFSETEAPKKNRRDDEQSWGKDRGKNRTVGKKYPSFKKRRNSFLVLPLLRLT